MDIQKLIADYANWLKNEISFEKFGEYYEITTPYLDNANDYLQIYIKQDGDDIYFTDDGATINGLKMFGFKFTPKRKAHFQRILNQYGIKLQGDELVSRAHFKDFAQKKHLFIQAILRVDDMFAISKANVTSLFLDDIRDFFDEQEIFYSDNVQFTGISGFAHSYDFLLQRSRKKPERLCQAINNPSKSNMGNVLFAWNDTKPSRRQDSQLIVILNDHNNISHGVEEAFYNYDAKVILWSERNYKKNLDLVVA